MAMFWNRFVELCTNAGKSPSEVAAELSLSNSTTTTWKNGSIPRPKTLRRIAEYFGVTIEYLISDGEKAQSAANDKKEIAAYLQQIKDDPSARMMFDLAKGATMEEIKATVAFLKALREQR